MHSELFEMIKDLGMHVYKINKTFNEKYIYINKHACFLCIQLYSAKKKKHTSKHYCRVNRITALTPDLMLIQEARLVKA